MSALFWLAASTVAAGGSNAAPATGTDCEGLLPQAGRAAIRSLTADDLVRLRDIGPVDPFEADTGLFTLSPDGKQVAFQLRRGDPATNSYCLGMVVVDLTGRTPPRLVDSGGAFIRDTFAFRGKADFPTGIARVITPLWAPDGRSISFLKRVAGRTQIWRAFADGRGSAPLTDDGGDIDTFRIRADGNAVLYSVESGLAAARQAITQEGLRGWHYDARYSPSTSSRPFPSPPLTEAVRVRSLLDDSVRTATKEEAVQLLTAPTLEVRNTGGRRAWLEVAPDSLYPSRGRLIAMDRFGKTRRCAFATCADASHIWWTTARHVRFLRSEGWAGSETAIYEWRPGPTPPRRLYVTQDLLVDCEPSRDDLLCLREGSLTPRRLERLDPTNGRRTIEFDPNPEFANLTLGRSERLRIRNLYGLDSVADLVLPVGYEPHRSYPMIVVQYNTRGFLRGGTGDDYPIQAFANRGYAVLSVSRPKAFGLLQSHDFAEIDRINLIGFADRWSVQSSLENAVRIAIARGVADPQRIGITGVSDGGSTAQFALLHSNLFAAAAMSQCCSDTGLPARIGPAAAEAFYQFGYPKMTDDSAAARTFWAQIGYSANARRLKTPTLLQLADDEYWSALQSFTALREVGAPIDMFVFPGEHHVKWQPAHRLAVYERAIAWFDFWLKDERQADPARRDELAHWDALRRERDRSR